MPSRSIESEHVLGAKALSQWMLRNERFELAHCGAVAAERELGFEPPLERVQTKVLETGAFRPCERLGCELGQRRPAPERQRLAEPVFRPPGLARVERLPRLRQGGDEAIEIELLRVENEGVAGRARLQGPRGQQLAQVRDVDLHHLLGRFGHVGPPEVVDDPLERERAVGMEEQQGQERPLLAAAQP